MERIRGYVEKILWSDPESGSVIATMRYSGSHGGMEAGKINGRYKGLQAGDFFESAGDWQTRANRFTGKKEEVFKARSMKPSLPQSAEGARVWLAAIFDEKTHGTTRESIAAFVGNLNAASLVAAERDPSKIAGASSDPARFREAIVETWRQRISGRKAVSLLESSGIEDVAIAAVVDAYRESTFDVLKKNPFTAARVQAFGFGNADRLATTLGISPEDDRRIVAAFLECIERKRQEGDTYVPITFVTDMLSDEFGIAPARVNEFVLANAKRVDLPFVLSQRQGRIVAMNRDLVLAEASSARKIVEMLARPRKVTVEHAAEIVEDILSSKGKKFDDIQRAAVATCVSEPFAILTGGPGTGKSTVTEIIVEAAARCGESNIKLAAPTGKAANRIAETTGRPASTVHLLLEATQSDDGTKTFFRRNKDNPLPADSFVIIDEASMVDAMAMKALMEAIPPTAKLLLVGDPNQLPSVDAGSVLLDLLSAEKDGMHIVPRAELINVYRQDPKSRIAIGAAQIKDGELPTLSDLYDGGLVLYQHGSDEVLKRVEWIVEEVLIKQGRYPVEDIVVLSPQAKGRAGTWEINNSLSRIFNPGGASIPGVHKLASEEKEMPVPRVGDRIMLTENEPKNGVMNGDTGKIVAAFEKDTGAAKRPFFRVCYDCGKTVEYPASQWRKLILAYAVTIHKSQGSQYHNVIMPVVPEHERMLDRSILYTGWTRTKTSLFLVGQQSTIDAAVANVDKARRNTRLPEFLQKYAGDAGIEARYPKKVEERKADTVAEERADRPEPLEPVRPRPPARASSAPAFQLSFGAPAPATEPRPKPVPAFKLALGLALPEPVAETSEAPSPRF